MGLVVNPLAAEAFPFLVQRCFFLDVSNTSRFSIRNSFTTKYIHTKFASPFPICWEF